VCKLLRFVSCYRCKGLILLETYTSNRAENFELPPFLEILREVTGDLDYSMYNLSKKNLDADQQEIPSAAQADRKNADSDVHDDGEQGSSVKSEAVNVQPSFLMRTSLLCGDGNPEIAAEPQTISDRGSDGIREMVGRPAVTFSDPESKILIPIGTSYNEQQTDNIFGTDPNASLIHNDSYREIVVKHPTFSDPESEVSLPSHVNDSLFNDRSAKTLGFDPNTSLIRSDGDQKVEPKPPTLSDPESEMSVPNRVTGTSLNDHPETFSEIQPKTSSELKPEVPSDGLPNATKNGICCNIAPGKIPRVPGAAFGKLELSHGSRIINGMVLQNGDVVGNTIDGYERFSKFGKSGAVVK